MDKILDAAFKKTFGAKFVPVLGDPAFDHDEINAKLPVENSTPLGSRIWKSRVKFNLLAGFGVEDIAIKLRCHPDDVRKEVRYLRWNGQFTKWWPK